MSYNIQNCEVKSSDGVHTLKGIIYIPEGEIKGIVQVAHGMTEHIRRYGMLMDCLAAEGYVCFGYDHLGHGKTAENREELGFFAHKDGWKLLVKDVDAFAEYIRKLYPGKQMYLFGHSMGSFIARLALENYGEKYRAGIICGTAGSNPAAPFGLLLMSLLKLLKGEKSVSKLCLDLAFGSYNKRFDGDTAYEWLTTDSEAVKKYLDDEFCGFDFTVSGLHDLVMLATVCNRKKWFCNLRKDMPLLLISGLDDPVGNYGKGVKQVFHGLRKYDIPAEMKLYDGCRHEILGDSCKEQVLCDIKDFIIKK